MARMRWPALVSLAICLVWAAPAYAASQTVDCDPADTELDDALAQAVDGDVITIAEGATCDGHFDMPSGQTITLEGAGTGATLDGTGESQILSGTDVGESVVRNLTFTRGVTDEHGGAIRFNDAPVTIENNRFFRNFANDDDGDSFGGAVAIDDDGIITLAGTGTRGGAADVTIRNNVFGEPEAVNTAVDRGGAVYVNSGLDVDISGNTFFGNSTEGSGGGLYLMTFDGVTLADNRFEQNVATAKGGGATIRPCGEGTIDRNQFVANRITTPPDIDEVSARIITQRPRGAGLHLQSGFCPVFKARGFTDVQFTQFGNRFEGNIIENHRVREGGAGAGESVEGTTARSTNDTYFNNLINNPGGVGAGLATEGFEGGFEGRNLVAAANKILVDNEGTFEPGGEGGGVWGGDRGPVDLVLYDSTIVSNVAEDGSGIAGNFSDNLTLYNSIVHGNTGATEEISGFQSGSDLTRGDLAGTRDVRFTIACVEGAPHPGDSNLCVNPLLADPANGNVHQTSSSPSIDTGSNSLVPTDPPLPTDFEGDGRILGAAVDRGADEVVPTTTTTTTTPPPTTPAVRDTRRPRVTVAGVRRACTASSRLRVPIRVNERVRRVVVLLDGRRIRTTTRQRFTLTINARRLRPGRHRLRVVATDRSGNTTRLSRVIARCAQRRAAPVFTG